MCFCIAYHKVCFVDLRKCLLTLWRSLYHNNLSRLMTKPTKWLCARRRLRSVWDLWFWNLMFAQFLLCNINFPGLHSRQGLLPIGCMSVCLHLSASRLFVFSMQACLRKKLLVQGPLAVPSPFHISLALQLAYGKLAYKRLYRIVPFLTFP